MAPRFHLQQSFTGNAWRFRSDLSDNLIRALQALALEEPAFSGNRSLPELTDRALGLLGDSTPIEAQWRGPVYELLETPDLPAEAAIVVISPSTAALLEPGLPDWLPDTPHRAPFLAAVIDGQAVSVCASVRISPTVHEAGVETQPDYRGCGYARAVVAAWANAVRRLGARPLYSTSWENEASQSVARSLNARLIGADCHIR